MRKAMKMSSFSLAVALLFVWSVPADAQAGPLDGKTFAGSTTEKGKAKADKDTFVFKGGKFRSTMCDAYGFTEAAYTAAVSDASTRFEAEATSPTEGTMKWKGTVKGDSVEGTAVWSKRGQTDTVYTFKGTLKK